MKRKRKTPERKCVITGEMKPKKDLIRVVRNKEGEVFVDPTGKKNGRGAYVSQSLEVIEQAEETNALAQSLQAEIQPEIYAELKSIVSNSNE